MADRTALYELYDADGALLYVGISNQPLVRFAAHSQDKSWWPDVATWIVNWHETRESAASAEALAIRTKLPRYNKALPDENGIYRLGVGRPKWTPTPEQAKQLDELVAMAAQVAEARAAGWAAVLEARQAGVSDKMLCEATGWSRATLNRKFGPRKDRRDDE